MQEEDLTVVSISFWSNLNILHISEGVFLSLHVSEYTLIMGYNMRADNLMPDRVPSASPAGLSTPPSPSTITITITSDCESLALSTQNPGGDLALTQWFRRATSDLAQNS